MSIMVWIILGAFVGWLATVITRTNDEQEPITNMMVGIVGAFMGGAAARVFGNISVNTITSTGILLAILGASILLFFSNLFRSDTNRHNASH